MTQNWGWHPAIISVCTIRRVLNRHGYRYLQSCKKGILTSKDAYKRLKFARQMKRLSSSYFWKSYISFYFDVTSFAHKTNPYDQARAVKLRAWRRGSEGLALHLKSKGKKAGVQRKVVHFLWLSNTRTELYAMIIYRKMKWYFFLHLTSERAFLNIFKPVPTQKPFALYKMVIQVKIAL